VKQLSSRWVIAVLVVPVLLVLSILIAGVNRLPEAAASNGKGYVQVAFTGAFSSVNNFPRYQSVLLNVIAVRFNQSSDTGISSSDLSWQTVAVAPGATSANTFPSLSFGGSFGPNGNSIGVGSALTEMQIDLAQLQNNVTVFNIGKVDAITYKQVELELDTANPGNVTPVCGTGTSTGEGCINYGMQLPTGVTTVRFAFDGGLLTVARNSTVIFTLAINAVLGTPPVTSNDLVQVNPEICPVPIYTTSNAIPCSFSSAFPPATASAIAGIVTGKVVGATSQGFVNAQLPGTGTIVSSALVSQDTSRDYTMILPAGTYDFVAESGQGLSIDTWSSLPVPQGTSSPGIDFNLIKEATKAVGGNVNDACSGASISDATIQLYGRPKHVGLVTCPSPPAPGAPAACVPTCDDFSSGQPPAGCVVLASTSTGNLGAYPFSPSGKRANAFNDLPLITDSNYGIMVTASGYNGELLSLKNTNGSGQFNCDGSGFSGGACSFSLQHGTLQLSVGTGDTTSGPINVMVNAEDQGTFNGEGVQMFTVPPGQATLNGASMIVPIAPTAAPAARLTPAATASEPAAADENRETLAAAAKVAAVPTPTGTPVVIGGAAAYDLFASVQDLFDTAPQKVGGHKIAVVSGAPAPSSCATSTAPVPLAPMPCVGHGSVQGTLQTVDQNTLLVVSKNDGFGNQVDISSSQVPLINSSQNFSICEPVDTYTVTHYETQPTGSPSPVPGGSVVTTLAAPTTIVSTTTNPCHGICSTPVAGPTTCVLCQATGALSILP